MAEIIGKRTINKSRTEQRINLRKLLGRKPTEEEKQAFTTACIEQINIRTLDGDDVDSKKFTKYSEEYAEAKGVSVDAVDLFLRGTMLDSIKPTRSTPHTVSFGIVGEGVNNLKSFNHNTGDTLPKREFFGITKKEAQRIADEIKQGDQAAAEERNETFTISELRAALGAIGLRQENGES